MGWVAELSNLEQINLDRTRVTDTGLDNLKALKSLQTLHLSGSQVTPAGVKELRRTLPWIEIQS